MISLLTLGILGTSGCSKKVTRQADVVNGDYYTEEEYKKLGKEQANAYCDDLATELERLSDETANLNAAGTDAELAALKRELAGLQSRQNAQKAQVDQVREQIAYFESLPKFYKVVLGNSLWRISAKEEIYADPFKWPWIFEANRDKINDPDLIYPDQVFDIPR